MAFVDFIVKYNPKTDTQEDLAKKIMEHVILYRLKYKKPAVIYVSGDSGEGKSYTALYLQSLLLSIQGLDIREQLENVNVFYPIEYPKKLDNLLHSKELKKVNIICLHEAREIVKARLWHSFLNQSISDINAMSRSVKRLVTIVISQFIRDIDTSVRYTLNFYCKVRRPMSQSGKARLQIYVLWKDDRDLEKPKLRKRRLSGYIQYPSGIRRRFTPKFFEVSRVDKDIAARFEELDKKSKSDIIKRKVSALIQEMEKDIDTKDTKVNVMIDWYMDHIDNLKYIGVMKYRKFKVNEDIDKMHGLTKYERDLFQKKLNERLKEKGIA